jgi:hypothetical protein
MWSTGPAFAIGRVLLIYLQNKSHLGIGNYYFNDYIISKALT